MAQVRVRRARRDANKACQRDARGRICHAGGRRAPAGML